MMGTVSARKTIQTLVFGIGGFLSAPVLSNPLYSITDLGTLYAYGINASGQVVGQNGSHAFLWDSTAGMRDLGTLGGTSSSGQGINASGQVVGMAETVSGSQHAFLWDSAAGMRDLGTLGGTYSNATGINASGQIVGSMVSASGYQHAFLWGSATGMRDLGALDGGRSGATGINASGQVVGMANTTNNYQHAFLWDSAAGMRDLGTLGGTYSFATGINTSGQVVGLATSVSDGNNHAFLWDRAGGMRDLGTLGGMRSNATGINASGQVVGYAETVSDGNNHAFLWDSTAGMRDLNSLIPVNSGWFLSSTQGINDIGQIVGLGLVDSQYHAVLLSPTLVSSPPTTVDLAKLAQDVYQAPQGTSNYAPLLGYGIHGTTGNNGFAATAYQNGNQIVIAVRGTDLSNSNQAAYNLLSDTSFVTGNPDLILSANVSQLAGMVADITNNHPEAQITLTGHSLGGAIAQIVGDTAHIAVNSFDAPGTLNLIPALSDQLQSLASLHIPTPSNKIINYRLYGDQVSLVGNQIASTVVTVGNTLSNILIDEQLNKNPMSFLNNHSLATLITQLDNGATQTTGQPGVNVTPLLVLAVNIIQVTLGEQLLTFTIHVLDIAAEYLLDPPAGTGYLLQAKEGSPYLKSVTLPYFENVSAWDFQYHTEQGWSASEVITSIGEFDFGLGVDAIKFTPLDSLFDPTYIADSFAFGVTFASTGTFEGTVTALNNTKSVPEPSTLPLSLLALLVLLVNRLNKFNSTP